MAVDRIIMKATDSLLRYSAIVRANNLRVGKVVLAPDCRCSRLGTLLCLKVYMAAFIACVSVMRPKKTK
jgi:hypothetical protein